MSNPAQPRLNADKPHLWKSDAAKSVDSFNRWFMREAPAAFRATRLETTRRVIDALIATDDLRKLSPDVLKTHPAALSVLRMCAAPPLAVDRLAGLAKVKRQLVQRMEQGRLPTRAAAAELDAALGRILDLVGKLLDEDVFPWIGGGKRPTRAQRERAATIVADRLCGAVANPIVRNAQERRQLNAIAEYLDRLGYHEKAHPPAVPIQEMEAGTYAFHLNLWVGESRRVKIPIDVVIQPRALRSDRLPLLLEAKSAGDFANTNKRRKEEATKVRQLRETYGDSIVFVLFLCGYFDTAYLGYEAAEGIDWVWEHRIDDLAQLGL